MNQLLALLITIASVAAAVPGHASRSFNGSDQWLSSATTTSTPFTISLWYYPNDVANQQVLWYRGTSGSCLFYLIYRASTAGKPVGFVQNNAGAAEASIDPGISSTGAWHHIAAVATSSTSRTVYLDGASATDTTSVTVAAPDTSSIGSYQNLASNLVNGYIAEAVLWDVVLTATDIASLNAGCSPFLVRPDHIVFYAPLSVDINDLWSRTAITEHGTTTTAPHPRIYR